MNDALDVANYIIAFCNTRNIPITHLKLQKLLYFVQANFLFTLNEPCFNDEIIALPYGPVVRSVFEEFRSRNVGASQLTSSDNNHIHLLHIDLIDETLVALAKRDAFTLVEMTHNQSPWRNAFNRGIGTEIENSSIREFFRE
ncbi:hypothetical protein A6A19_00910 [Actinobacillus delphinicola]|uniref:Panacea domain-containing protein n=1 Tax=Actinobacillus delphinicola TaxID=51161 RepID=UPI0024424433|nr:type II toxin-antitoxin system antitoxin SocA domain-containing protein [Actinobacillus delphinicola]MDG6896589.1 hypothetical protein [Actinobacillus delphinicola]